MEWVSHSERETEELGERLSAELRAGDVLAFRGGLGLGKTAFLRGVARGLGFPGRVTSPTFTIVNEYEGGRLALFHFDLYRLTDAGELWDLDWDAYQERGGVCAVEWSERAEGAYPPDAWRVTLERGPDEYSRRILIERGDDARQILIDGGECSSRIRDGAPQMINGDSSRRICDDAPQMINGGVSKERGGAET